MGFQDTLDGMFPTSWLDPYGSMPLNKEYKVQIDITQVETDDGIRVTAVKTPPRAGTTSITDAINMALGFGCCDDDSSEKCDYSKPKDSNDKKPSEKVVSEDDADGDGEGEGKSPDRKQKNRA